MQSASVHVAIMIIEETGHARPRYFVTKSDPRACEYTHTPRTQSGTHIRTMRHAHATAQTLRLGIAHVLV